MVTLHRPANVDRDECLRPPAYGDRGRARGLPVVFPGSSAHREDLAGLGEAPSNFRFVDPQPYLEFNYLVRHAKAVITDSGGSPKKPR